jgi:hypothetical protein
MAGGRLGRHAGLRLSGSRASTARGRSAPAGRAAVPSRPCTKGRGARARTARPGEPACPRAAAPGPAQGRKGGLKLPAEDRAAPTTLGAGRMGVREAYHAATVDMEWV